MIANHRHQNVVVAATRSAGFTLIELILAMSVAAMLALSLYASMSVAFRAQRTAEAAVRPVRSASIAMDLVGRDLGSVMPPTGILAGPMYGSTNSIDVHCLGEDAAPRQQTSPMQEGMREVVLAVNADVDPPTLVRRVTRNLLSTNQTTTPDDEEVLCRGVHAFSLRYFDGTTWQTDWDTTTNENVLPGAVEMTLELQSDPSQPAKDAETSGRYYHLTRVIPLACAPPAGGG